VPVFDVIRVIRCVHNSDVRQIFRLEIVSESAQDPLSPLLADLVRQFADDAILNMAAAAVYAHCALGVLQVELFTGEFLVLGLLGFPWRWWLPSMIRHDLAYDFIIVRGDAVRGGRDGVCNCNREHVGAAGIGLHRLPEHRILAGGDS